MTKRLILTLSCITAVALLPFYGALTAIGLPAWILLAGLLLICAAVVVADRAGVR